MAGRRVRHSVVAVAALVATGCSCSRDHGPDPEAISVANPQVRACDLLLDRAQPVALQFDESVVGRIAERGGKMAVSFAARADAPMHGVARRTSTSPLSLVQQTCYDRSGRVVSGTSVSVD